MVASKRFVDAARKRKAARREPDGSSQCSRFVQAARKMRPDEPEKAPDRAVKKVTLPPKARTQD